MLKRRHLQHLWLLSLTTLVLWSISGFTTPAAAQRGGEKAGEAVKQNLAPAEEPIDPNTPLDVSFRINVSVKNEPEPSGDYDVLQSGIILIHVAEVKTPVAVRGLTPIDAGKKLTEFLKNYMKDPEVTVSIVSVPQPVAYISGAIKQSGQHFIRRSTTLADLLSKADWTPESDLTQVYITRTTFVNGKDKIMTLMVNLSRYLMPEQGKTPDATQNPTLMDRDSIFIPLKSNNKVTQGTFSVAGEVAKAAPGIPLRTTPALTLREAIAFVGGTTANANRKRVSLRRPGQAQDLYLDLDKAETGDTANNVEIHNDDAIYVEKLGPKSFVEVNGAFPKPGPVIFPDNGITLTEAVMKAGGLTPLAKEQEGIILRHPNDDPKSTQIIPFKWQDIMKKKASDIALLPGDAVYVASKLPTGPGGGILGSLQGIGSLGYLFQSLFGRNGVF